MYSNDFTQKVMLETSEVLDRLDRDNFHHIASMRLSGSYIPFDNNGISKYKDAMIKPVNDFNFLNNAFTVEDIKILQALSEKLNLEDFHYEIYMDINQRRREPKLYPLYLIEFLKRALDSITKSISDDSEIESDLWNSIVSDEVTDILIRQCVRNASGGRCVDNRIDVTHETLKYTIIPFAEKEDELRNNMITEYKNLLKTLTDVTSVISAIISIANNEYKNSDLNYKVMRINEFVYHVIKTTSNTIAKIINSCSLSFESFDNTIRSIHELINQVKTEKIISESSYELGYDAPSIEDIAYQMMHNSTNIFDALSSNILNYHAFKISNHTDPKTEDGLTEIFGNVVSKYEYDKTIYENIKSIFNDIMGSLVILRTNCNDNMIVFDDVLSKAMLTIPLRDRFANIISSINDIPQYPKPIVNDPNSVDFNIYYRTLNEIHSFSDNMKDLSTLISEVDTYADEFIDYYSNNINDELANIQLNDEINQYLETFSNEYSEVVESICENLLDRLKSIADVAEAYSIVIYDNKSDKPSQLDGDDFTEYSIQDEFTISELHSESVMLEMSKNFMKAINRKNRGVNIIFTEAGGNSNNEFKTETNKSEVSDNTVKGLNDWFVNVFNTFDVVCERQSRKNKKWLDNNKDLLMNRRYVNVSASIIPYDNMDENKILTMLDAGAKNIKAINNRIDSINTEDDMVRALFPFIKISDVNNFNVECINYFKSGDINAEPKEYKNSELGTFVTGTVIPFCDRYYDSYVPSVKSKVESIKNATIEVEKTVTESCAFVIDNNLIVEATDVAEVDTNKRMSWLRKYAKVFTGCALNAIRDRNNEYFKLLSGLIPKTKPTYSESDS